MSQQAYVFLSEPPGGWQGSLAWRSDRAWSEKLFTALVSMVALLAVLLVAHQGPALLSHASHSSTFLDGSEDIPIRSGCGATAPRVLITGYGPFENVTNNPSERVARLVNGSCIRGVRLESWVLSVSHKGAQRPAAALASGSDWAAIVHLGFESIAKGLKFEIAASNVAASEHLHLGWSASLPCNKSGTRLRPIRDDAPCLLATTAPLDRLSLPLSYYDALPPVKELWSRDAGAFFCNEIYFRTLDAVRDRFLRLGPSVPLLPVIFVHLPPVQRSPIEESAALVEQVARQLVNIPLME